MGLRDIRVSYPSTLPPMANDHKPTHHDEIMSAIRQLIGRVDKLEHRLSIVLEEPAKDSQAKEGRKIAQEFQSARKGKLSWPLSILRFLIGTRLGSLVAVFGTFLTVVTAYVSLRYDISVLPFASLDSSDPTTTRFLVTNEGPFTISNVFYACEYAPPRPANSPFVIHAYIAPSPLELLRPHGQFSAFCGHPSSHPEPFVEGTMLDVDVFYTPKFLHWQRRGGTLFLLKFDKNQNAVWLPVMDLTTKPEDLEKLSCQTCKQ